MASTSFSRAGIDGAAGILELKEKRDEIGDVGKFRRMCESVVECSGFKFLHVVVGRGESETCKFLVEEVGVDIDVQTHEGDTPLLIAVKGEQADIARYLIKRGADITTADSEGFTALHFCVIHEDTDNMTLLLTKGADIEADSIGGTPLHCAVRSGSAGIVNFLLLNKAKPNSVSKYLGISPLISAIYFNTDKCVELLLNANADPNKCANGLSPLAHAVEKKSNSCINVLIAAGADVDAVSSCGLRPIEHAALVDNVEAIWMLILARPRIMATPNWSLGDMLNACVAAKERRDVYIRNLKQNGDNAWDKKNYSCAIASYSEAIHHKADDEKVLANRSLCWALMGEGLCALHDAELCIQLKPDWAKAYLRAAIAWHILQRYCMASRAFKRAYELTPENEEIERCELAGAFKYNMF